MKSYLKNKLKRSNLFIFLLTKIRLIYRHLDSQSNESDILNKLLTWHSDIPKTFVEIGFGAWEFNCIKLANHKSKSWEGLLIDGDEYQVKMAKNIYHKKISSKNIWLTLENLDPIYEFTKDKDLGVLSIDIDGNDFWFLKKLVKLKPAIIVIEYNSNFGQRMISVPYEKDFNRTKKHSSCAYFGASLKAFSFLLKKENYSLIEISSLGNNAFYLRNDLLVDADIPLDPAYSYRESFFNNSEKRYLEYWEEIKDMDYVEINEEIL